MSPETITLTRNSQVRVAELATQIKSRFEFFWYKLRGDESLCCETTSYGFGNNACWSPLSAIGRTDQLPVFDFTSNRPIGAHVLVVDRLKDRAYFVQPNQARKFMQLA